MVSDEEAADIVISNLKKKGFEVVSRDNIIADIKAIKVSATPAPRRTK